MSRRTPPKIAPKGCQHIDICFEKQRCNFQQTPPQKVECPVCNESVVLALINMHLDECVEKRKIEDMLEKGSQQSSLATANKRKHASCSNGPKKKKTIKQETMTVIISDSDGDDFQENTPIKWKGEKKSKPNASPGTSKQDDAPIKTPNLIPENLEKSTDVMKASTSNGASVSNNLGKWQSEISGADLDAAPFSRSTSASSCSTNIFDLTGISSGEEFEGEGSIVISKARLKDKSKSKRSLHFEECVPVLASEFTHRLMTANKLPFCIAKLFYGEELENLNESKSQRMSQEPDNADESIAYSPSNIDNLLTVCKVVLDEPGNIELFNDVDLNWLKIFYSQSESAQKLYVRLFQRKFKWFPLKQLEKKKFFEGMELEAVLLELHSSKLLMSSEWLLDLETALRLLHANTLKKLCKKNLKLDDKGNKVELIERVLDCVKRQRVLELNGTSFAEIVLTQVKDEIGECYMLDAVPRDVLRRILTLYNLVAVDDDDSLESSPLTKLTLVNMGKVAYPGYVINIQQKIFRNREDLLRFVNASSMATEIALQMKEKLWSQVQISSEEALKKFRGMLENNDILSHDKSLPMFLRRFTAGHVLAKCLYYRVEALQKIKAYIAAVEQLDELLKQEIYCQSSRGRWYDRMSLNLDMNMKDKKEESLGTIIRGLCDRSISSDYNLALCKRGDKLANELKGHTLAVQYRAVRPKIQFMEHQRKTIVGRKFPGGIPGYKSAFLSKGGVILSVEEYALEHYAELGYSEGIHGEGSTIVSIFGLLLWDVIYSVNIPDVFRTPHQVMPLDLHTDEFYENRQREIDARVAFISSASTEVLLNEIRDVWEKHKGEASIVNWEIFGDLSKVQSLVRCMSNTFLARLCEKLSGEYRNCRGGVPDLVVWNPENFQWMMVEVKGPNDNMSVKQRMWLDFLVRNKVKAEELSVSDKVPKRLQKLHN